MCAAVDDTVSAGKAGKTGKTGKTGNAGKFVCSRKLVFAVKNKHFHKKQTKTLISLGKQAFLSKNDNFPVKHNKAQ